MYVITREENEYDQYGDYFETVFLNMPTLQQLSTFFYNKKLEELEDEQIMFLTHIRKGGGRVKDEHTWYNLVEIKEGIKYTNHL